MEEERGVNRTASHSKAVERFAACSQWLRLYHLAVKTCMMGR